MASSGPREEPPRPLLVPAYGIRLLALGAAGAGALAALWAARRRRRAGRPDLRGATGRRVLLQWRWLQWLWPRPAEEAPRPSLTDVDLALVHRRSILFFKTLGYLPWHASHRLSRFLEGV